MARDRPNRPGRPPDAVALEPEQLGRITPRGLAGLLRTTRFATWQHAGLTVIAARRGLSLDDLSGGASRRSARFRWDEGPGGVMLGYRRTEHARPR